MLSAIAPNTVKQYNSALGFWWKFCQEGRYDPYNSNEKIVLSCLTRKFKEGAGFQSVNTLRSAIHYINQGAADNKNFQRFFKGIFRLRPTEPKYTSTWDIGVVLDKLEEWGNTEKLDLRRLTLKLVILLALGSAFRCQGLALLRVDGIKIAKSGVDLRVVGITKTSRPGTHNPSAFFPFFLKTRISVLPTLYWFI